MGWAGIWVWNGRLRAYSSVERGSYLRCRWVSISKLLLSTELYKAFTNFFQLAGEALVVVFVIRNTLGTVLALYTTDWQAETGIQNVSCCILLHLH